VVVADVRRFFETHPVFTLEQFRRVAGGRATDATIRTRVKYHLGRGHLKLVEQRVYAVVPAGVPRGRFVPDRFLVAAALREDAVLAYHSALELLGYAHSTYRDAFFLTARRRKDVRLGPGRVRALLHPKPLRDTGEEGYGVEVRERLGVKLKVTGPERTLVDCLAAPRYAGGVEEALQSARGIPTLDLERLAGYLDRLGQRRLFAVVGFVLEAEAQRLFVRPEFLQRLAREGPGSPTYLDPRRTGGRLQQRWNLVVPTCWSRGHESVEV
jgi:predicted transcriptional regulator of viral defense system